MQDAAQELVEQHSKNDFEYHANPESFGCESEKKNWSKVDRLQQEGRSDNFGHDERHNSENSGAAVSALRRKRQEDA